MILKRGRQDAGCGLRLAIGDLQRENQLHMYKHGFKDIII
jgi:hypothetical protein